MLRLTAPPVDERSSAAATVVGMEEVDECGVGAFRREDEEEEDDEAPVEWARVRWRGDKEEEDDCEGLGWVVIGLSRGLLFPPLLVDERRRKRCCWLMCDVASDPKLSSLTSITCTSS